MRIARRLFLPAAALLLLLLLPTAVAAEDPAEVHVQVNGVYLGFDVPPRVEHGRTLVPWRGLSEYLGLAVEYRPADRTILTRGSDRTIAMQVDDPRAQVGDSPVILDVPPRVEDGRTLVPLRFVAEALGFTVDWDAAARTVRLRHPAAPVSPVLPDLSLDEIHSVSRGQTRHDPRRYATLSAGSPDRRPLLEQLVAAWGRAVPAVHPQMSPPMPPYGTTVQVRLQEGRAFITLAWQCGQHPDGSHSCTPARDFVYLEREGDPRGSGLAYAPDLVRFITDYPEAGPDEPGPGLKWASPVVGDDVPLPVAEFIGAWMKGYLQSYVDPYRPEPERLLAYDLNAIRRWNGDDHYQVTYSVRPATEPTDWWAGSGEAGTDGWVRHKVKILRVVEVDGSYILQPGDEP